MSIGPFRIVAAALLLLIGYLPLVSAQAPLTDERTFVISTYAADQMDLYEDHLYQRGQLFKETVPIQPISIGQLIGVYSEDDPGMFIDEAVEAPSGRSGGLTLSFDADNAICDGANGEASVEVTGGTPPYAYQWSNGFNTDTIGNLLQGSYFVTVTDATGATVAGNVLVDNDIFNIQINFNSNNAGCGASDGSLQAIALMGSAPYSYEWNNGINTSGLNNIASGAYRLTVTDANGCTATALGAVSDNGAPGLNFNTQAASCFNVADGSASVAVSGGNPPFSYSWSTGSSGMQINNVLGGAYPVTVTDGNGCQAVAIAGIGLPPELIADVFPTQAACGGMGGRARIEGIGGIPPYSYLWATGDTIAQIGGLVAGLYMASVTDANGCTDWGITSINTAPPPVSVINAVDASCSGVGDGAANLTVLAGQPPFDYQWSNGAVVQDLSNIPAGTYAVTLTDANGCSNTNSVTIDADKELTLAIEVAQVSSVDANDGALTALASGGTAPYNYQWSTGSTGASIENLPLGIYAVTATDANGCFKTDSLGIYITGIDDPDPVIAISTYPNPASDQIHIELTLEKPSSIALTVIDMLGRVVHKEDAERALHYRKQVDLRSLQPGFYALQFHIDGKAAISRKFIKVE